MWSRKVKENKTSVPGTERWHQKVEWAGWVAMQETGEKAGTRMPLRLVFSLWDEGEFAAAALRISCP